MTQILGDSDSQISLTCRAVRWLIGRASNSEARGRGFETYLHHVVSLGKTLYFPKVLVIPRKRWLRPDMTEKLLTGTLNINTNKQIFNLCGAWLNMLCTINQLKGTLYL